MDEDTGNVVVFNVNQRSAHQMSWRKRGFLPVQKTWKKRGSRSAGLVLTAMYLSAGPWPRTSHTPIINRMCGTSLSGWSKSSQTKSSKRVVRNWPHGYNPFPFTYGGLQEPAMVAKSSSVKSGSQCMLDHMLPTSTSGQVTSIFIDVTTNVFLPQRPRRVVVGLSQACKLT